MTGEKGKGMTEKKDSLRAGLVYPGPKGSQTRLDPKGVTCQTGNPLRSERISEISKTKLVPDYNQVSFTSKLS